MSLRWIDTIKNSVTQQTEQRRGLLQKKDLYGEKLHAAITLNNDIYLATLFL
jgi:hypothetical protein